MTSPSIVITNSNNPHNAVPYILVNVTGHDHDFLPFPLSKFRSSDQSESHALDLGAFWGEDLAVFDDFDGDVARLGAYLASAWKEERTSDDWLHESEAPVLPTCS